MARHMKNNALELWDPRKNPRVKYVTKLAAD